jgi:hypothetical protein
MDGHRMISVQLWWWHRQIPIADVSEGLGMDYNYLEMTNGTKYRVLLDFDELVETVDRALKAGGLLTVPMGITKPGSPSTINPRHVVAVTDLSGA